MKNRFPGPFPQAAFEGDEFKVELPAWHADAIPLVDLGIWAGRLSQPDQPFRGQPPVAGRVWTTDFTFRRRGEEDILVGIRVTCSDAFGNEPITFTRPGMVLGLAKEVGLWESDRIDGTPRTIESEDDIERFWQFLTDPKRRLPVFFITPLDGGHYLVDPDDLARRTLGTAYVVKIPWDLGFRWTLKVGKPWSAFLGAVRTYRADLDFEGSWPTSHPLALAERIEQWSFDGAVGRRAFEQFLVQQALADSAHRYVDWETLVFWPEARSIAASSNLAHVEVAGQQLPEEVAELIEQMKAQVAEEREHAEGWFADLEAARIDLDSIKEERRNLIAQVDALRSALANKTVEAGEGSDVEPLKFGDFEDCVATQLAGRLKLHQRAIRGLDDAEYEDVGLAWNALCLLADDYRDMKKGLIGRDVFNG